VLLGILPKLYSGAHVRHPKVRTAHGMSFRFDSAGTESLVDLDGEMVGRLPLEVTILPQAFQAGTV
jgi:diacylglycerol kinase family enzyme